MSTFAAAVAARPRAPARVCQVPAWVWAQTWTDRPTEPLPVGLRTLSAQDLADARGWAESKADKAHPGSHGSAIWIEAYNSALMIGALGRALCSPECADVPFWDYADGVAPMAIEPTRGAVWLWSELEVATAGAAVLEVEAGPLELLAAVQAGAESIPAMSEARRHRIARHLDAALTIMRAGE